MRIGRENVPLIWFTDAGMATPTADPDVPTYTEVISDIYTQGIDLRYGDGYVDYLTITINVIAQAGGDGTSGFTMNAAMGGATTDSFLFNGENLLEVGPFGEAAPGQSFNFEMGNVTTTRYMIVGTNSGTTSDCRIMFPAAMLKMKDFGTVLTGGTYTGTYTTLIMDKRS